ncbi:YEATS domain-containing protein 4-like [Halichondria panicea]|uniref:YEATS domain-containing protein 4-like n=1 Tax=Halichondria panicea TaxID=6063 RepID=UPI00312BA356
MAEPADGNARRKGVILTKSIVYGNIAKYFGKKRDEDGHTHAWTCYFRPFKNEDMSTFVRKVQFKLHESIPNPIRVITRPPYEVGETGWGEFEIIIKVFFVDPSEKPLTIYHLLKLFQNDPAVISGKKNVVSEQYDEIVFTDPTSTMYRVLTSPKSMVPAVRHEPGIDYKDMEEKALTVLNSAQKKIKLEIHDLSEQLKASRESTGKLKDQIEQAEDDT